MCFLQNKAKVLLKLLTVVSLIGTMPVAARAGGNSGGGGDAVAQQQFVGYAQAWDQLISALPEDERMEIDPKKFHDAVTSTVVRRKDHIYFEGEEVDAVNERNPNRIYLSRSRIPSPKNSKLYLYDLALHEYLGILGLDRHYEISVPFSIKYLKTGLSPDSSGDCMGTWGSQFIQVGSKSINDFLAHYQGSNQPPRVSPRDAVGVVALGGVANFSMYLIQFTRPSGLSVSATLICDASVGNMIEVLGLSWHSDATSGVIPGNFQLGDVALVNPKASDSKEEKEVNELNGGFLPSPLPPVSTDPSARSKN